MNLGRYGNAIQSFDRAIAINPGFGEAQLNRAAAEQIITQFNRTLAPRHLNCPGIRTCPVTQDLSYRRIYPFTIVTILYMTALTKRIPVSEPVWKDLAELRRAGQTYDDILMEMIELQKKQRLEEDIRQSLEEGDFIPLSGIKAHKNRRIATGERSGIKNPRNKRQGLPA
jgi:predicted CopG family antitoxin